MKAIVYVLMMVMLLALVPGCGGDKDKGMNSPSNRKDWPRTTPTENDK